MIFYVNIAGKPLEIGEFRFEDSLEDVLRIEGSTCGEVFSFVCYTLPDNYKYKNRESCYKDLIFHRYVSSEEFEHYFVPYKHD